MNLKLKFEHDDPQIEEVRRSIERLKRSSAMLEAAYVADLPLPLVKSVLEDIQVTVKVLKSFQKAAQARLDEELKFPLTHRVKHERRPPDVVEISW